MRKFLVFVVLVAAVQAAVVPSLIANTLLETTIASEIVADVTTVIPEGLIASTGQIPRNYV